jgi:hypothetical protein
MLIIAEWMNATKINRTKYFIIPPKYNLKLGHYEYPLKASHGVGKQSRDLKPW